MARRQTAAVTRMATEAYQLKWGSMGPQELAHIRKIEFLREQKRVGFAKRARMAKEILKGETQK